MQIVHGTARQVGFGRVGVDSGRADQPTVSTGSIVTSSSRPVVTQ
jgi:hypothetical protein